MSTDFNPTKLTYKAEKFLDLELMSEDSYHFDP